MKEQAQRSSRLIGTSMLAIDIVRQEHRLHLVGFKIAIQKFAQAARQECHKLRDLLRGDCSKPSYHSQEFEQPSYTRRSKLRRRFQKKRLKVPRQLLHL